MHALEGLESIAHAIGRQAAEVRIAEEIEWLAFWQIISDVHDDGLDRMAAIGRFALDQ